MNNLPIKDSERITEMQESSGVFIYSPFRRNKKYIKVYNDLCNSWTYRMECLDYGCFNDEIYSANNYTDMAKNFVRLYCRLRDNGFYHRDTAFMLGSDSNGRASMICVMPELNQSSLFAFDNRDMKYSLEDYIRTEASPDTLFGFNYGLDKSHNIYLIDLHVFRDCSHDRLKFRPQK